METSITNKIRFMIDECLPPLIRDSRAFMYPLFYIWFKGKKIKTYMEFKSLAYSMSEEEFERSYQELDSLATDRETDTNRDAIEFILSQLRPDASTLLDVACGRGYFLKRVNALKKYELSGSDLMNELQVDGVRYLKGNLERLPFEDKQFDIVSCQHSLEHVRDLKKAVSELKRITKKQLIVVVPVQKYFYFTLDMHLHFFPIKSSLQTAMGIEQNRCSRIGNDWVYIADLG